MALQPDARRILDDWAARVARADAHPQEMPVGTHLYVEEMRAVLAEIARITAANAPPAPSAAPSPSR